LSDPIEDEKLRAVQYLQGIKGVSDVQAKASSDISGGGVLVTTSLKRDGRDTWGWYFEKGEIQKALFTGEEIALFISKVVSPKSVRQLIGDTPIIELAKLAVMSFLTLVFSIAVVAIVILNPGNQNLQILTGLLGLTIGYFVGKGDRPS
jgi:hypothetical protein